MTRWKGMYHQGAFTAQEGIGAKKVRRRTEESFKKRDGTEPFRGKKTKKAKGLSVVFLILILLMGMVSACSSNGGSSGTDDGGDGDGASTKLIRVWLHKAESDDEGKIYRALADQFNDSNIKAADGSTLNIRLEYKGTADTLSTAISSEILTGGLPDIIAIDASAYAAYRSEGVIVPLDAYITEEQKNSYVESVISQATVDGELYGLSGMDAPGGMYYNKEILTEAVLSQAGVSGYGTIENPWSWEDVYAVLKVLRDGGAPSQMKLNLGFGGTEGCMYLHSSLIYSGGGSFALNGKFEDGLTSEASLNGLRSLEKILKNEDGQNYSYIGENADAFAQGEIPLQIFGPWDITTIAKKYPEFSDKYDIMPVPVVSNNGEKGTIATPCGSWGFAVTKDSKKVEDAAAVIAYLTGKEASLMFHEGIGTFPTNQSLYTELPAFTEDGPLKSLSRYLIETAVPRPVVKNYPKLAAAYSGIIEYIETMVNDSSYDLEPFVADKAAAADEGI